MRNGFARFLEEAKNVSQRLLAVSKQFPRHDIKRRKK